MGGSRHSKNAGTMGSEGMTYHERRSLGFGTVRERIGKESIGNFYDCRLTLQPAEDPVCTPDGYIFSKEAILQNLLDQKKANKRKFSVWKAQQDEEERKGEERRAVEEQSRLVAFDRQNHMGATDKLAKTIKTAIQQEAEQILADRTLISGAVTIQEHADRMKETKAFWLPSKAPEARDTIAKPDMLTYCPASKKKLKLKDLIPVKFSRVPEGQTGYAMDPVTGDTFTNANKLVLLRATGDVMLQETYEKCVKPDGQFDGILIQEKDVIKLQRGGTGFAANDGDKAQASSYWYLGPGSGKADLRGQHQGAPSKGGLTFMN